MAWKKSDKPNKKVEKILAVPEEDVGKARLSEISLESRRRMSREIANKIFKGMRKNKILDWCEESYGISRELAQEFIDFVFLQYKDDVAHEILHEKDLAIVRSLELLERVEAEGDHRTALEILKHIAKLRGTYAQTGTDKAGDALARLVGGIDIIAGQTLPQGEIVETEYTELPYEPNIESETE
jgi:hypothetical protein